MIEQKRARAGGERGANGEWYEGGKFIATTEAAKKCGSTTSRPRKAEVAPFVWREIPAGRIAIYPRISLFVDPRAIQTGVAKLAPSFVTNPPQCYTEDKANIDALMDLWNRGHRWTPAPQWQAEA